VSVDSGFTPRFKVNDSTEIPYRFYLGNSLFLVADYTSVTRNGVYRHVALKCNKKFTSLKSHLNSVTSQALYCDYLQNQLFTQSMNFIVILKPLISKIEKV
jgi:hypothetical protein